MKGFTLIEMLIAAAIVALLATVALPLAEVTVQRNKEQDLRRSLREVRGAIDAYKRAMDEGRIEKKVDRSGYPPSLTVLVEGVKDVRSPKDEKIFFLRRLPRDPLTGQQWGLRSYASAADSPQAGDDVYDVFTRSSSVGLNGVPYKEW
ncbi:MAG TPA: prepilin-type N-terminal cleavage/methylation domain-containing protein [Burkholderiales bacterium]|jgi:general secretion pathway protein G|nr:prepilin-type N-terminal cleavage/methylation domain-containing protein [Burkholderiales bacterium]